jgi:hypothetical protein
MDTTRHLRPVESPAAGPLDESEAATQEAATQEYWARMQQLRADLARLSAAN